jgi:hypothetical protein
LGLAGPWAKIPHDHVAVRVLPPENGRRLLGHLLRVAIRPRLAVDRDFDGGAGHSFSFLAMLATIRLAIHAATSPAPPADEMRDFFSDPY